MPSEATSPDDLYGLPPAEFIPARDALARSLRTAGDRDAAAAAVKQLRKPTLAAWALNQAARRHPDEVARLLEAGERLRAAQEKALAGDPGRLREASRELNQQLDRLAETAAGLLEDASPVRRDRIGATLRAAATDEEAGDRLRRGVLAVDLDPAGFGLEGFEMAPAPRPRPVTRRSPEGEAVGAARRELRRADAEAEAAQATARRRVERAEAAERRALEAHREAQAARSEAEEAAGEAEAARRRAADAANRLAEVQTDS